MHIIIGGAGDTGTFIAEELSKKDLEGKYSVTVLSIFFAIASQIV